VESQGAADEAALNTVNRKKNPKNPPVYKKISMSRWKYLCTYIGQIYMTRGAAGMESEAE
jgi:hypothetical protein